MAASDKFYRSPKALDVVFGVSSILLLASVFWMLYDDNSRPYKPVQRTFRDVEEAVVTRAMLDKLPDAKTIESLDKTWEQFRDARKKLQEEQAKIADKERQLLVEKANYDSKAQSLKADSDSLISLINIAIDQRDNAPDKTQHGEVAKIADDLQKQRQASLDQQEELNKKSEEVSKQLMELRAPVRAKDKELAGEIYAKLKANDPNLRLPREDTVDSVAQLEDAVKKLTADLDRLAKVSAQKRWKFGDWFRSVPVIDGFASPYRIDQITLNDLTINYGGFREVPRYDRCTTCHLGIDRANYDPQTLAKIADDPKDLQEKHKAAVEFLRKRAKAGEDLGFDPGDLSSSMPSIKLTPAQIKQYAAHPRLDLFVDSNSPHAAEKFGCTACHGGQGSSTDFVHAAHSPNDAAQQTTWMKDNHWEHSEFWDFPMQPARFVESGCVKCHHQMTDLIRYGNKEEAPKLLKGYNLVRDLGCFGCHEISGLKGGKQIGPDMRLEPWPALDTLTPEEQVKAQSDPLNPPGTQRKVGPSLRRLSEKVSEQWTRKWIQSPRSFRPDTKMPHFYGLSTNDPSVLPDDQKKIPDAEIHSISHYLMAESKKYLNGKDDYRVNNEKRLQELLALGTSISDKERKELGEVQRRLAQYPQPSPLTKGPVDGEGKAVTLPETTKDLDKGRTLFTERGCLACHQHEGTTRGGNNVASEAHFGPNLSNLAAKIGAEGQNPADGRRWLVQWILNPNVHFSRTRMPITHLNVEEAAAVADWLMNQKTEATRQWVDTKDVPEPSVDTLADLAKMYLRKAPNISPLDIDSYFVKTDDGFKGIPADKSLSLGADEEVLKGGASVDKLKYYIGRKTISRMGCFGCHDIPGFESAKPIGTALNDWGKKDPERLAFEDSDAFVKSTYHVAELRDDPKDPKKPDASWGPKDGKRPIEKFFADALEHHKREGFLNLKLMAPRSYDFHRDLKWDDRTRMPQFKFSYPKPTEDEDPAVFAARAEKEEAEAREAVMTFILGLVAEPVNAKYLSVPKADRLAEVKGRKVLDKFNCAGCHQVRPGIYEFNLTEANRKALQTAFDTAKAQSKSDFFFEMHNAWAALQAPATERTRIFASNPISSKDEDTGEEVVSARLAQATSFVDEVKDEDTGKVAYIVRNIPAGISLGMSTKGTEVNPQFGGTFSTLMLPYMEKKNPQIYKLSNGDSAVARKDLPPTLVREGERVQPDWLFAFLKNPYPIRPQVILRMPKFNMSDEDAQTLVSYFAGADHSTNPGIGLSYPYQRVPEREESYWNSRNHDYVARLAKANQLEARAEKFVKESDKLLAAANEADKSALEADLKAVKEALGKKDSGALQKALVDANLYWHDAYKLLATPGAPALQPGEKPDEKPKVASQASACLQCHNIGQVKASEAQAPPLDLAQGRLRADWMEWWIANPNRMLTYPSHMPQNFLRDSLNYQELFPGSSLEQIQAARDILSNHSRVAELPVNRSYRKATATGGK